MLSVYYYFLLDEGIAEDKAFRKIHLGFGISPETLNDVLEQWECYKKIRVTETASRGKESWARGKASLGTLTCLQQYVDKENEAGRTVTTVEAARWLTSEPRSDWESARNPVHVSPQTVSNWLY